ncbi:hypothetical protein [Natronococcus wangiae]|uniref:hypothetical protein n=1 Tax=Natronococcus wangiae TaxID=3068275 RepID=UPI00273F05F6|nr:hypothetical protein [Natronococcus sp. AD5]
MDRPGDVDSANVYDRDQDNPTNSLKEKAIRRQKRRIRGLGGKTTHFDSDGGRRDDVDGSLSARYGSYPICECGVEYHETVYKEEFTDEELKEALVEIGKKLSDDRRVRVDKKGMVVEFLKLLDSNRPEDQFAKPRDLLKYVVNKHADVIEYEPKEPEFFVEDMIENADDYPESHEDVDNSHLPDFNQPGIEIAGD